MLTHYYDIHSETDAYKLISKFEENCLLAKKSFLSLFNGGETDISKDNIIKLLELSDGVESINNWLLDLEDNYKTYCKELNPVLNEDDLIELCNEISSLYVIIDNDIIFGTNLRNLTLSKECVEAGQKVIDIFCDNYPFELSFDDYSYNIYAD